MSEPNHVHKLKVALIGDEGVGKTSLIHRFVSGAFDPSYIRTLGVVVSKKTLELSDPEEGPLTVHLMVQDLMGKQTFMHLFRDAYFHGVQGVLAVFDITRPASLRVLPQWIDAAREVVGPVPMVILGNKTDLSHKRETTEEDAAEVLGSYGSPIRYTSAKSGDNVEEAFRGLASAILGASTTCGTE